MDRARVPFGPDKLKHCIPFFKNIGIPKTQHFQTLFLEVLLANPVVFLLTQMAFPVKLQHQGTYRTVKVCNVMPDNVLAAEAETTKASATQFSPQEFLGRRLFMPQLSSTFY